MLNSSPCQECHIKPADNFSVDSCYNFKEKAKKLLQISSVPTTEVCEYVYGTKSKKSTLNQKKTGVSPLLFQESCRIIEYYGRLAEKIDKIISR